MGAAIHSLVVKILKTRKSIQARKKRDESQKIIEGLLIKVTRKEIDGELYTNDKGVEMKRMTTYLVTVSIWARSTKRKVYSCSYTCFDDPRYEEEVETGSFGYKEYTKVWLDKKEKADWEENKVLYRLNLTGNRKWNSPPRYWLTLAWERRFKKHFSKGVIWELTVPQYASTGVCP